MNTKLLSQSALDTIDQYLHFRVGAAQCNVPYFNNKRKPQRAALRAVIGKGSPREILDEVEIAGSREHINRPAWTDSLLKRFMCDHDIGIDCSGLAYYILDAENRARGMGSLDRHLAFPDRSLFRRMAAKLRPVENADVVVFAHEKNGSPVPLKGVLPGDLVTMIDAETARNHVLVIHQVDYQNFVPMALHYTHSIAWSDDGEFGHGARQGVIEILDPAKPLVEQKWIEKEKAGDANGTLSRAKSSKTELRRFRWL